jgi:hypothetical protein
MWKTQKRGKTVAKNGPNKPNEDKENKPNEENKVKENFVCKKLSI